MKFKIVANVKLLGRGGKDFYIMYTLMQEMAIEYDFGQIAGVGIML